MKPKISLYYFLATQTPSLRPLTAEASVLPNPCGVCGRQIGTGTGFPLSFLFSPVTTISPMRHSLLHPGVAAVRGTKEESMRTFQKDFFFRKLESTSQKITSTSFILLRNKPIVTIGTVGHPGQTVKALYPFDVSNTLDIVHRRMLRDLITCCRMNLSPSSGGRGQGESTLFDLLKRANILETSDSYSCSFHE